MPLLSLTHGQPATPTTLGKELAVYVYRLNRQLKHIENQEYLGKINGATGTFGAHLAACPDVDWIAVSREFVTNRMGLTWNPLTTQIESHDWQAELYSTVSHANRIMHNLCVDVWMYISRGVFAQVPVKGATGSSTMPHKVNPTAMRACELKGLPGMDKPYEKVKELMRGHTINKEQVEQFIDQQSFDPETAARLKALTPATYTGVASQLVAFDR